MSINHVVVSGKISKPPRRVRMEDGNYIFVFPLAVRTDNGIAFPMVSVYGELPHFVTYYGDRPLADQPIISIVGARMMTRNIVFTREEIARMFLKAGIDRQSVQKILEVLPDNLKVHRVVTELWARPEQILPGGVW